MASIADRLRYLREIIAHPLNRDEPVKAASRYVAWNLGRRLLRNTEFLVELVDGVTLAISNEENYATLVYTERLWDFEEMSFMLHFLREEDRFVDIGSNVGGYTVLAGAVAKASCVAIEASPRTFLKLKRNVRLNGLDRLTELHNVALGEQAGEMQFTRSLGGLDHIAVSRDTDVITVPVTTLDSILSTRGIHMMKMDVEGYEKHVLTGSKSTLENATLQAIVVELNGSGVRYGHSDNDVHLMLVAQGFRPARYDPWKRTLSQLPSFNTQGMNTLYCRGPEIEGRLRSGARFSVRGRRI